MITDNWEFIELDTYVYVQMHIVSVFLYET
jgi:hypothetical protein